MSRLRDCFAMRCAPLGKQPAGLPDQKYCQRDCGPKQLRIRPELYDQARGRRAWARVANRQDRNLESTGRTCVSPADRAQIVYVANADANPRPAGQRAGSNRDQNQNRRKPELKCPWARNRADAIIHTGILVERPYPGSFADAARLGRRGSPYRCCNATALYLLPSAHCIPPTAAHCPLLERPLQNSRSA